MSLDMLNESGTVGATVNMILLVEDEPDSAQALKTLLEQRRYSVRVAKDGGQAQAMFVMHKPDFVILDLILPGESGFEICERLKQTDDAVPVVVLSAIDMNDARELAQRVGADAYLTKPFEPEQLLATIPEVSEEVWLRIQKSRGYDTTRVRFSCSCGKRFKVSAAHRGKSLTCPKCGEPLTVPKRGI
jgi:two-component system, OmpR family, response regulator